MRSPLEIRNDAWECLQQAERAPARRDKAILLILAQWWASLATEMERLGRLSGEVLLHASVLKRLELNCPGEGGSKRAQDPGAELERDVQKMPEDFQAAFSLQLGATHKLGDFIVRDLLKKSGGCATDAVRQARTQAEDGLVKALRNWRAR